MMINRHLPVNRNTLTTALVCLALAAFTACDNSAKDSHADGQAVARVVGQLESDRIELTAEFSEPIIKRLVIEGQTLNVGDVIMQQDSRRANAKLRELEALAAEHQANLDELIRGPRQEQIAATQANVDGALKDVAFRQDELRRAESLLERQLASPSQRDQAKAALDNAQANLSFNRARLTELLNGTRDEDIEQARAVLQQTQARLEQSRIDAQRLTISAPVAGVIDSLLFEPGERPQAGQPIAIMLSGAQPYARVYIPAALRVMVQPGTQARVFVDGLKDSSQELQGLKGKVRWVASEASFTPYFALTEYDRGRLSYLAKIDIEAVDIKAVNLEGTDRRLPDGVPVEVELMIDSGGGKP